MKLREELREKIIPDLYEWMGPELIKAFQELYNKDHDLVKAHFGAGMSVRNFIRQKFPDIETEVGNLDDYWEDLVFGVLEYNPGSILPQEKINRLDTVN